MGLSLGHGRELDVGDVGIDAEALPPFESGAVDLCAWFKHDNAVAGARPLELEIGSGKGTFLVQQAAATPHIDYIGLEYAKAFWRYAADRCRRRGLTNVRIVRAEAAYFIRNYVPDAALRQVHIYFPDPWPKKRHHKRRLIQTPFLHELHRILAPGFAPGLAPGLVPGFAPGLVRIATDHSDYFAWIAEYVAQVPQLFERLPFESPQSAGEGELVGTNFERKYRREGRPFHGMILRKRAE